MTPSTLTQCWTGAAGAGKRRRVPPTASTLASRCHVHNHRFHELGHESQRRPDGAWSYETPYGFNDATEVTVNLFSVSTVATNCTPSPTNCVSSPLVLRQAYSWHRLDLPSREGWGWAQSAAETMERAIDLLGIEGSTGKDFGNGGAGDKLSFYLLLQHAFGWGAYKDLIRMYSAIEDDGDATTEVPTEGQDKRDGFLLRMSNITGYSLAKYVGSHKTAVRTLAPVLLLVITNAVVTHSSPVSFAAPAGCCA